MLTRLDSVLFSKSKYQFLNFYITCYLLLHYIIFELFCYIISLYFVLIEAKYNL